jgi:type II secretory pathway component PulC
MRQSKFPPGWDEERVRRVLADYEQQTEAEAVTQDEVALEDATQTVIEVPNELVPAIRELIAKHQERRTA